jgi:hypothetical protein
MQLVLKRGLLSSCKIPKVAIHTHAKRLEQSPLVALALFYLGVTDGLCLPILRLNLEERSLDFPAKLSANM